jgi:hypothetical protein
MNKLDPHRPPTSPRLLLAALMAIGLMGAVVQPAQARDASKAAVATAEAGQTYQRVFPGIYTPR